MALFTNKVHAQVRLTGTVTDTHQQALSDATVVIQMKDSTTYTKYALSDSLGHFSFDVPKQTYRLQISYIGLATFKKEITLNSDTDLGLLSLQEGQDKTLQGVTVVGKKPLIERKVDRLVFNVEQSIVSQGMSGTEVLTNTPMVTFDNGTISLIGRGEVSVMINDRILNLSGEELINYLQSIRSDNISKIEVITSPPANYQAQGNGGIINIILKKNIHIGWSGSISTTYTKRTNSGYSTGLTLNYLNSKFSMTITPTFTKSNIVFIGFNKINGLYSSNNNFNGNSISNNLGGSINLGYKLSKNADIGIIYNLDRNHVNKKISSGTNYVFNNILDSILQTKSAQTGFTRTDNLSAFYNINIDNSGKKIIFAANYFSNSPSTELDFNTANNVTASDVNAHTLSQYHYKVYSGQADVYLPYKNINIEYGTKYTHLNNTSDIKYYDDQNESKNFLINSSRSNVFDYKEDNLAFYVSSEQKITKKLTSKFGLRYEYAWINGYSLTLNQESKYNYGRFFPTAYLLYNLSPNHKISLAYSRRINRPNFSLLNPFRTYSNPYSYYEGNPFLKPSYNQNIELSYNYQNNLSVMLYKSNWINGNAWVSSLTNGYNINIQKNFINMARLGLNVSYSLNPFKFWNTYISSGLFYASSNVTLVNSITQNGVSANFSTNNTFYLNSSKTFIFLLNNIQYLNSKSGNIKNFGRATLNMGFKVALFDKNLQISAIINDAFRQNYVKGISYFSNYNQTYGNYYDDRSFNLTLVYHFGNKKINSRNKPVQFDENNRAN